MQILEPTGETKDWARKYPWDVWLEPDGNPRVLDQRDDFPDTNVENMRIYIYQQADARDLKAVTKIVEKRYVIFQVYKETEEDKPLLPNWRPTKTKPKCRHCAKVLDEFSIPYGEHRKPGKPNQRSCK